MRIKKHHNRNEYALTIDNIWVRNFCKEGVPPIDINNLVAERDCKLFLDNEVSHRRDSINNFQPVVAPNVIIVSDGYDFGQKQQLLEKFNNKIMVMGVNGALRNWKYADPKSRYKRAMNWYVVNNPYPECQKFLPSHGFFPPCIMASRTNISFAKQYKGNKYLYHPTPNALFQGLEAAFYFDDYRNPVCAAISVAYSMKARKIILFCCDNSFEDDRPAAEKLENGLWAYPQQLLSHHIIDAMAYWLKTKEIIISDYSSGPKYEHIPYIGERELVDYFGEEHV